MGGLRDGGKLSPQDGRLLSFEQRGELDKDLSLNPGKEESSPLNGEQIRRSRVGRGFPGSSASKESTCNAGDPSSIPGSASFPGERIGYPLQYSWASLVAQTVKNPPAMPETWV